MKPALFLDRDGIIVKNINGEAPKLASEVYIIEDAIPIINEAKAKGYLTILISNQPDIALGKVNQKTLNEIENKFLNLLKTEDAELDGIYYCYHHESKEQCECRKPLPGMILKAARDFKVDLKSSFFLGDRASDVKAAKNGGVTSILYDPDNNQSEHLKKHQVQADFTISKLAEVLKIISPQS